MKICLFYALSLTVLFVAVAGSFTAGIIIYLNFDVNKPSVLYKSNDLVNRDRRCNVF